MNRQEVFDKVTSHLLTQNKPSEDEDKENCLYRSSEGLKCAIGCLIPDELYTPKLEGITVDHLPENILNFIGIESKEDLHFMKSLQVIHDFCHVIRWKSELKKFASEYGLQWNHGE